MAGKRWTESEVTRLKEIYSQHSPAECAGLLGRSKESVTQKASALKLKTDPKLQPNAWTAEQVELLKELYHQIPSAELAARMGRSPSAVQTKAYKLGLATARWTEEETALLKEQYPDTPPEALARQLNRTPSSIYARVVQLNVRRTRPWTEEDLSLLKELYPHTSCREVARRLGRSPGAVGVRASQLGLKRIHQSKPLREQKGTVDKWTAEQEELLKELYPHTPCREVARLLGRSPKAVSVRASRLGLKQIRESKQLWEQKGTADKWTAEQEELLKELYPHTPCREVAGRLGRSAGAVSRRAALLGLKSNARAEPWTGEQVELLKEIYPHSTPAEAAARIGRDRRSVISKAHILGLRSVSMWSAEEEQYLEQSWGKISISAIVRKLNRTQKAVSIKATKLGLGFSADAGSYITLPRLLQALDRAGSGGQCARWRKRGLPVHIRRISDSYTIQVVYRREFWQWAEENRTFIDFSRVERGILGKEPDWVAEQRKLDRESASRYRRRIPWTPEEDERLIRCLRQYRYTMAELCSMLHRSANAVNNRTRVLGLKERPLPDESKRLWTPEDRARLRHLREQGMSYELIGEELGRTPAAVSGQYRKITKRAPMATGLSA